MIPNDHVVAEHGTLLLADVRSYVEELVAGRLVDRDGQLDELAAVLRQKRDSRRGGRLT